MSSEVTEYETPADRPNAPAKGRIRFAWGKASMEVEAEITPSGFAAIGGMVGLILLAVVPIVRAGGKAKRRW